MLVRPAAAARHGLTGRLAGCDLPDDPRVAGTRATYDRIAEEYAARSGEADLGEEFRAWRAAAVASVDGPVADLGCGPGRDLALLQATGTPCVGVDLSAGMVGVARRAGLPVVRGDLRRPPLRPASLAAVYSVAALLHVPREDVPATLLAWRALLRPGGTCTCRRRSAATRGGRPCPTRRAAAPQEGSCSSAGSSTTTSARWSPR